MSNSGIILTLAYPETIVMVSDEWFIPFLRFVGIGKKNYVRAGHAALVLINKESSDLEYYDFGRYITPKSYGRVRGFKTDNELQIPLKAEIENDTILNLNEILKFFATHPKLTHGEGKLVASICMAIDYQNAQKHISHMQNRQFILYAAFKKEASNCSRFVTDTLISSVTDNNIRRKLVKSKWFTPSTVGNVLLADTENYVYEVSEQGRISKFRGSQKSENLRYFLDNLKDHKPNYVGTMVPKTIDDIGENAQWLHGIGSGAWFELYQKYNDNVYRFKRISVHGNIDVDDKFVVDDSSFNYDLEYEFLHASNCELLHVKQKDRIFRFHKNNF
ncbi:MAG: hypothetical protein HKO01_04360 [Flaviramulus sp.]|nr:DUF6695 family protein [Flaviramulus sp.]NNC49747.1 hypothetical protein [Flaviramulus sp.]